jgi:hypothetical protein
LANAKGQTQKTEVQRVIKGCQRDGIFVQWKDDSMFESAYFVLRAGRAASAAADAPTMLREANRIIEEGGPYPPPAKRGLRRLLRSRAFVFAAGLLFGSLLGALAALLL